MLVNPAAAGGRAARRWQRLEPGVRASLPGLTVQLTGAPGDAEQIARRWALAYPDGTLITVGGDGTVHEAVNGMCTGGGSGPFGVIPAGSGNDFARNAGIPLDPEQAARRLAGGTIRRSDLGRLVFQDPGGNTRSRVFLNSLSLGVSVRANRLAHAIPWVRPGRLRYALGALAALVARENTRYQLNGESGLLFDGPALNLTVANGASFGGGMRISPTSSLLDGTLELVVLGPMSGLRAVLALSRLQRGTHVAMPEIRVIPLRGALRLALDQKTWRAESDGQELEGTGALTLDILAGRLALLT